MSTRSGKRIHASSDSPIINTDVTLQSERKTRTKRKKENIELSVKKLHNYVSYPADEHTTSVSSNAVETYEKVRKTPRNTLKHHNVHIPLSDNLDSSKINNTIRKTHRGKKLMEESDNAGDIENIQDHVKSEPIASDKKKRNMKKEHEKDSMERTNIQDVKNHVLTKKGIKKKSKGINSVTYHQETVQMNPGINVTSDSFHSAAGSPVSMNYIENDCQTEVAMNIVEHKTDENFHTTRIKSAEISSATKPTDISIKKKKKLRQKEFKNEDENIANLNTTFNKSLDVTSTSYTKSEKASKKKRQTRIADSTFDKRATDENEEKFNTMSDNRAVTPTDANTKVHASSRKRKRSTIINSTVENIKIYDLNEDNLDTTLSKTVNISSLNSTKEVSTKKRRKSKNSTFENFETNETDVIKEKFSHPITNTNTANGHLTEDEKSNVSLTLMTFQESDNLNDKVQSMTNGRRKSSSVNTTYDKIEKDLECKEVRNLNSTFAKDDTSLQVLHINNESSTKKSLPHNMILQDYGKILVSNGETASEDNFKTRNFDSTFNKDNKELNTTFDTETKIESLVDSKKSSLISSDATINVTFDKSGNNSCISITSDESKTENILSQTPVLIESSIDESLISEDKSPVSTGVPVTPLKREGTFTKEVPDIVISPKHNGSIEVTPVKRKSSPGCTPFPFSKNSQKENAKLNVTRSIEKAVRRSSLVEVAPKQTRVMFCSPTNNPAVVSQVKGRVIKSNLKGSNKSFVFEDNVSSDTRAVRRKRSITLGAAGDSLTSAKRKRLGDELQHSVDRLSRPRTQSAAAKLSEPGSPSKAGTPGKAKVSRTKLPNFAALHQKQFARMESLDECQRRRAHRAGQLLTPTGSVGLLERISPKETPPKPGPAKEPATKLHTPKLPTLDSLIPRYTRFGFKMHVEDNPFRGERAAEPGARGTGPGARGTGPGTRGTGPGTRGTGPGAGPGARAARQTCLPSLAGATSRREAARLAVTREKSFSEKRTVSRSETRTVIKGVRTNRRFELQMKMRNIEG